MTINAVLEEVFPEGEYTLRELAEKAYATLQEEHSEELQEWQRQLTLQALTERAAHIQHQRRADARRQDIPGQVERMAETGVSIFALQSYPLEDNVWKPLGAMTGPDHRYVSDRYAASAKREAMLAQFHKQVARKLGNKTTAEVFTEEQYLSMLQSIVKPATAKLQTAQVA